MINLEKKFKKCQPPPSPPKKTCSCAIFPLFLIFQAPLSGGGYQNLLPKGGGEGGGGVRHMIDLYLSFEYMLGVYIFVIHFSKLSVMQGTITALNFSEKWIISCCRYLYILFTSIPSYDKTLLSQTGFPVLILLIVLLQNQDNLQKTLTYKYLYHHLIN